MENHWQPSRGTRRRATPLVLLALLAGSFVGVQAAGMLAATSATGDITTVAGNGSQGYSGDGGPATQAQLGFPATVAAARDGSGSFFIGELCDVRKVDSAGVINTVAGDPGGSCGYTGDGGPATQALLGNDAAQNVIPLGVATDLAGNLFIADSGNNVVRKVDAATQIITTVAGNGTADYTGDGGAATAATLNSPMNVAFDAAGDLFIADSGNHVVREVNATTQIITTVAGNGTQGYSGDGGPATSAALYEPIDVAVNGAGDLFIADDGEAAVRKVDANTQVITTVAGGGTNVPGDNGPATSAVLFAPTAVDADAAGDVFIAERDLNVVRKVDATTQIITTVAGGAFPDDGLGDNGPATSAQLDTPTGIDLDASGNLLIADLRHYRIRRVEGAAGPPPTTSTTTSTIPTSTSTSTSSSTSTSTTTTTVPGRPSISSLTPQISRLAGGTAFRIYGSGFTGTTSVAFGNAQATDFKVIDDSLITATSPPAATAGAADNTSVTVTVTNSHGSDTGANIPNEDTRGVFYTDAVFSVSPTTGLHLGAQRGDPYSLTLDGYQPDAPGAVGLANPLLLFLEGGPSFASSGFGGPPPYLGLTGDFPRTDASGHLSLSGTLPGQGSYGPRYDPNVGTGCPPNQATVDFGLPRCLLLFGQFAIGSLEKEVSFAGTPVPAPATLVLNPSAAASGATVGLSGVHWNANPYFGSDTSPNDPGETHLKVDLCNTSLTTCVAQPANATVDLTRYKTSSTVAPINGVFSGTNLAGSFTVTNATGCAPHCVVRVQQEGFAYDTYTGKGTGTYPVSATAPLDVSASLAPSSKYVMVAKDGGVFAPGGEGFYGTARLRPGDGILRDSQGRIIGARGGPLDSPVVAFSYTPTRRGYWLAQADGGVIPIGDAPDVGDLLGSRLTSPIVGAAATEDGTGLYLVAADGGIFALGTAPFKGSLGGIRLNKPIVGMGLDSDGSGYYLVASDGGVFAYEAPFRGSLGATRLTKPIVGMAVGVGGGYVLAASDGGAFTYGVPFAGSLGGVRLVAPIVGIAADPDGTGYWMAGADGGVFAFDAEFSGSVSPILLQSPISGIAALDLPRLPPPTDRAGGG